MIPLKKMLLTFLVPILASIALIISKTGYYSFTYQVNNNRHKE